MRRRLLSLAIVPITAIDAYNELSGNTQDMPHLVSQRAPATDQTSSHRRGQSLSQGELCTSDFDCDSFACARPSADLTAEKACCDLDYFFTGPTLGNVCTNQPPGASCLNNRDDLCESFVCVDGICAAEQLEDGMECDNASDCISRKCGRKTASLDDSTQVCCSGGESVEIFLMGNVCGNQELGAPCVEGTDGMCVDGMDCTLGYCGGFVPNPSPTPPRPTQGETGGVDLTKAQAGEACDGRTDCANNVCGLQSLTNVTAICCPTGNSSSAVCTGQPNGAPCLDPRELPDSRIPLDICESGYCCVPCGICKERLEAGEECQFDEDCVEGQCAPDGQGVRICCPEGTVTAVTGQCAVEVKPNDISSAMVAGYVRMSLTLALIVSLIWTK